MKCSNCGAEISEGSKFCTSCGTPVPAKAVPAEVVGAVAAAVPPQPVYGAVPPQPQPQPAQAYQQPVQTQYGAQNEGWNVPSTKNDKPLSMWAYVGYMILFNVPLVGIIFMFVFAFKGDTNVNLKNFSRGMLILAAIALILYIIFGAALLGIAGSMDPSVVNSTF